MMPSFLFFKYRHPIKNVKNKETWLQEELERSADAWATEFVEKNMRPQLTSWLRELDGFFPEQLPSALIGSGGLVLRRWQSRRTTIRRRTWTGTCPIL